MANDFLSDMDEDEVAVNGDFAFGESTQQELADIIRLNKGQLKSDPLLGPELVRMVNAKAKSVDVEQVMRDNLSRDNKDYDEVKEILKLK
ncbi:MAG: hypothetical protein M9892_04645 [Bacteroidetes bacterium]|nr:hypothetical protein [Bacteroidota bacterium]